MAQEVTVRVRCPRCGRVHTVTLREFERRTVVCPCGAVFVVTARVTVKDFTEILEMLPEFQDWLVEKKKLAPSTAKTYASKVEAFIRTGEFPKYTAPFDYFREFLVTEKKWHPTVAMYIFDV